MPENGFVSAKVYDLLGREVATVFEGVQTAGVHDLVFDASGLTSGIYLYKVQSGGMSVVGRMMLLR